MGENLSFAAGSALFIVSIMVVVEYWPSRETKFRGMPPAAMLGLGICLGFFLTASNTLWWQIMNGINSDMGFVTRETFQQVGFWMDIPLKGGMAMVGLIHLRAKQKMRDSYDPRT